MARRPRWLTEQVQGAKAAAVAAAAKAVAAFKAAVTRWPPSTEKAVALLGLFVAGLALWMSETQTCEVLKSTRLSQTPSISSVRDVGDTVGVRWTIRNDGIGPLNIVDAKARLGLATFDLQTTDDVSKLWTALSPLHHVVTPDVIQGLEHRMLPAGGSVTLIDLPLGGANADLPRVQVLKLQRAFRSLEVEISFEDVYGGTCLFKHDASSCPQLEELKRDHCGRPG